MIVLFSLIIDICNNLLSKSLKVTNGTAFGIIMGAFDMSEQSHYFRNGTHFKLDNGRATKWYRSFILSWSRHLNSVPST